MEDLGFSDASAFDSVAVVHVLATLSYSTNGPSTRRALELRLSLAPWLRCMVTVHGHGGCRVATSSSTLQSTVILSNPGELFLSRQRYESIPRVRSPRHFLWQYSHVVVRRCSFKICRLSASLFDHPTTKCSASLNRIILGPLDIYLLAPPPSLPSSSSAKAKCYG